MQQGLNSPEQQLGSLAAFVAFATSVAQSHILLGRLEALAARFSRKGDVEFSTVPDMATIPVTLLLKSPVAGTWAQEAMNMLEEMGITLISPRQARFQDLVEVTELGPANIRMIGAPTEAGDAITGNILSSRLWEFHRQLRRFF